MPDESFLLVSLEEEKSKKLAQVLSNDTARKILDSMSKTDYITETQIAEELDIPLSTAHYNLKILAKSGLINDDHYKYSEKGKKINHYSLSNKYVIIAPKKTSLLKKKLRELLPVALFIGAVNIGLRFFTKAKTFDAAPRLMQVAQDEALAAAPMLAEKSVISSNQEFSLWFLAGSVFTLLVYFVFSVIKERNRKL